MLSVWVESPLKELSAPVDAACVTHRTASRADEHGLTLVEMTIVVLMLGILLLIGIPAFLNAKSNAKDRSAQTSVRHAFSNAKGIYADKDSYSGVTPAAMSAAETGITFKTGPSTGPTVVSIHADDDGVVLAAKSDTGICYALGDATNAAGTVFANLGTGTCDADDAPGIPSHVPSAERAAAGAGWAQAW